MEDFGPVLWILIAGAAMAYSAASNAKKQAQKAKKRQNQEAWPTQMPRKANMRRSNGEETTQMEPFSQPNGSEAEPWSFDREYEEENRSEIQSLETPESISGASGTYRAAASTASQGSNMVSERFAHTPPPAHNTHSEDHTTDSTEETPLEIVEEFELRKAVIYAEILKPKFEE